MAASKRLSQDMEFVQDTVRRAMPKRDRPRLSTEAEKRFAEIDARAAECYSSMEIMAKSLTNLAEDLDDETPVPHPVTEGDDSLVIHIEVAKAAAPVETDPKKRTP